MKTKIQNSGLFFLMAFALFASTGAAQDLIDPGVEDSQPSVSDAPVTIPTNEESTPIPQAVSSVPISSITIPLPPVPASSVPLVDQPMASPVPVAIESTNGQQVKLVPMMVSPTEQTYAGWGCCANECCKPCQPCARRLQPRCSLFHKIRGAWSSRW